MDFAAWPSLPTVINSAFALFVVWAVARNYWQSRIDKKFGCSRFGGRGGYISIEHGGRTANVEFELAGKDVDLIIYSSTLKWIGSNMNDMSEIDRSSLLEKLRAWCNASRCKIELVPVNDA